MSTFKIVPFKILPVVTASSASLFVVTFKFLILAVSTASFAKSSTIIVPSKILGEVTASFASFSVMIPKFLTLNGLAVVPAPSIVFMSAIAPNAEPSIQATFPDESVTNTLLIPPEAIFEVVTAPSASLLVMILKSFTLNGLAVVPAPSMVVISATAPKDALSIQATFPVASVTKTVLFEPEAIFVVVTAASFNFSVVTFKFLISAV